MHKEDGNGKLKDHTGHDIEYVKYDTDEGYSFSIECMDCNEVLFSQTDDPNELVTYEKDVYEYDKYRIIVSPDYRKAIEVGDEPEQIYCEVYHKSDCEFENCLGEFNIMYGFEYKENTVDAIEEEIKKLVDESSALYELRQRETEFKRTDELFAHSVSYIAELTGGEDIKETLIEKLDMTEEEAEAIANEFEVKAEQNMNFG